MQNKNKAWWAIGLLAVLLLMSACGAETQALQPATFTATPAEETVIDPPEMPAETEMLQPTEAVAETTAEATPTEDPRIPEPELGFARGAPALKATSPSSFVRAAGKPQLVELFAFW